MCSVPLALCCPHQDCPSSHQLRLRRQQPWATACAPFMPTIPAGRRPEWGSLSSSCPHLLEGNKQWRNLCLSAAWQEVPHPAPWGCPIWAQMEEGCSHTYTSPPSLAWCPPHCRVPATYQVPRNSAAPRTAVMCGGEPALPPCAAKHLSTQSP